MTNKFSQLNSQNLEFKNSEIVAQWGKTIVFAPHPDDESLGCGGAIALLRKYNLQVSVVTMSDGTLSHPNSIKYPPEKLRELRETEMKAALAILGVDERKIDFLRYRDRSVPGQASENFNEAVEKIKAVFELERPQTVLTPWRNDPHPDHCATWQIVSAAIQTSDFKIRLLEYPIWLWELAEEQDLPAENEITMWRLDIKDVVETKQKAIRAHTSQITNLIDDDPQGFRLSPETLEYFAVPFEVYLEEIK